MWHFSPTGWWEISRISSRFILVGEKSKAPSVEDKTRSWKKEDFIVKLLKDFWEIKKKKKKKKMGGLIFFFFFFFLSPDMTRGSMSSRNVVSKIF